MQNIDKNREGRTIHLNELEVSELLNSNLRVEVNIESVIQNSQV